MKAQRLQKTCSTLRIVRSDLAVEGPQPIRTTSKLFPVLSVLRPERNIQNPWDPALTFRRQFLRPAFRPPRELLRP
jgi:hypothetical protein